MSISGVKKGFFIVFLVGLSLPVCPHPGCCEEEQSRREVRVIRLGFVDGDLALTQIQPLLSPTGRATVNTWNDTLIVVDTPETCDQVEKLIMEQQQPAPLVQIDIHYDGLQVQRNGAGIDITTDPCPIPGDRLAETITTITVHPEQRTMTTSNTKQSITVLSGHDAWIDVGEELPGVTAIWFFRYATRHGYLEEGFAEEIEYRRAGTRLAVRPRVVGNLVYIDVIPEMSYFIGDRLNAIAFTTLKTTVVAQNGQSVSIGSLEGADDEFIANFYHGYFNRRQQRRSLQITITPHIL